MAQFFTGQGFTQGINSFSSRLGQMRLNAAQLKREEAQRQLERQQQLDDVANARQYEGELHQRGLSEKQLELDRQNQEFAQAQNLYERGQKTSGGVSPVGTPGGEMLPVQDYQGDITAANPVGQISRVTDFQAGEELPVPRFAEEQSLRRASTLGMADNPRVYSNMEKILSNEPELPSRSEVAKSSLVGTPDADPKTPGWQPDPAIISRLKETGTTDEEIQSAISAASKVVLDEEVTRRNLTKPFFAPDKTDKPKVPSFTETAKREEMSLKIPQIEREIQRLENLSPEDQKIENNGKPISTVELEGAIDNYYRMLESYKRQLGGSPQPGGGQSGGDEVEVDMSQLEQRDGKYYLNGEEVEIVK